MINKFELLYANIVPKFEIGIVGFFSAYHQEIIYLLIWTAFKIYEFYIKYKKKNDKGTSERLDSR